ncbi:hypothetical protein DFJ73DRAFT_826272 [Zopfochytrium polystomum]|nr:hypothetical protein DFJ73DRAFT_826272 [Zopfochytrium polystomum]
MHNAWVETVHSSGLVPQNDAQLKQYLKQWQSNLPQHVLFTDLNQRVQDEFLASQSRQVTKWESPEAFIEELASLAKLLDPLVSVSVSKVDLSIVERANKKKTVSWKDYRKSETKPAGTSIPTSSATSQSTTIPFARAPLFDVPPGAVTFSAEPTVPEQPLSSLIEGWSTLYQRQDGNSMQEDMLQTKIGEQKNGSGEALKDKKRPQRTSSFGTTKQSSPEPLTETQPTATSQKKAMCHLWKHSGHYAEDCYVLHKELKCPVPDHWHLARNCYLNKSRVRHNSGLSDSSSDAIDDADTADAFNKADPDAPANFAAPKPRRFGVTVETMCKRPGCHNSHRADECFLAHPELICDLPGHSNHIKARCWSRQGREDKAKFNSERPERKSSQHQWSSSATDADNSASTQQQKQQQQNPGAKRRWEGETLAADKPTKKGSYRADPNHTALQVPPPSSSSSSTSSSTGASISPEPPGGANGAAVAAEGTPNTCLFCTKDRNHPAQDCPVLRKALVVATVHRAINADSVMKKQLPTPKALQDGRCEVCSAQHADGEVCKAWLAACELLQK